MPGLSQLVQFNKDILSLGDEVQLRAQRGERPVRVQIPKDIPDEDDSEEFIMGMPENEAVIPDTSVDDDLSDLTEITGITPPKAEGSAEEADNSSAFEAPDMSSLLSPMMDDAGGGEDDMPDLSMFDDPEPEEMEEAAESEPLSVADMSLDDLLGGAGFDGSEIEPVQEEAPVVNLEDEEFYSGGFGDDNYIPVKKQPKPKAAPKIEDFEEVTDLENEFGLSDNEAEGNDAGVDDDFYSDDQTDQNASFDDVSGNDIPGNDLGLSDDFPLDDGLSDVTSPEDDAFYADTGSSDDFGIDDIPDLDNESISDDAGIDDSSEEDDLSGLSLDELSGDGADGLSLDEISGDGADDLVLDGLSEDVDSDMLGNEENTTFPDDGSVNTDFDDDLESIADLGEIIAASKNNAPKDERLDDWDTVGELEDADSEDLSAPTEDEPEVAPSGEDDFGAGDLPGLDDDFGAGDVTPSGEDDFGAGDLPGLDDDFGAGEVAQSGGEDDFGAGDLPGLDDDFGAGDVAPSGEDDFGAGDLPGLDDDFGAGDVAPSGEDDFGAGDLPGLDDLESGGETLSTDSDFSIPDDIPEIKDGFGSDFSSADGLDEMPSLDDDFGAGEVAQAGGEDDFGAGDLPGLDDLESGGETLSTDSDFSIPDDIPEIKDGFGSDFSSADGLDEMPSLDDDFGAGEVAQAGGEDDLGAGDLPGLDDDFGASADTSDENLPSLDDDFSSDGAGELSAMDDIDSDIPAGLFDADDVELGDTPGLDDAPIEDFDTSAMEGMDFGITDTDSQLAGNSDFELGNADEFGLEGQDFEIPGFSDVETAKEEKRTPVLSKNIKEKASELPPNTLSDEQYKIFLKNLGEYPLNVRLAFEDLIVRDEFTEDAEFEVIEKILHKAPARQVATLLEKMLDISLPVPRDFEHRTAEEYEAYKKSLQYQLKNKIIPAMFVGAVLMVVGFGLFQFGKHCIYMPVKANSLYKQGYALLQSDEYPQSEIKFNEATGYRMNKNWFFKYARGYREHKQYIRAEKMYENILTCFNHDKEAGLEYADMELADLSNYEKAEEIVRRQVLDYHINDKDGILLLGDVFLEWGTEKDSEKLELARQQYATLLQLYGSNNVYLSRMMRYFVRTDNLRQVLQLKEGFMPKEKSLSAADWTEMSGFLLDKLYGPLSPSDEYLRSSIEDVFKMLTRAVKLDPKSPIAMYNLSRYFIETSEFNAAKDALHVTIDNFKEAEKLHRRDIYKYIDSYRLLGEQYCRDNEFLRAQENYTEGISLYTAERDASGFTGNQMIGKLYANQADIDYFVSGDYDNAIINYKNSVDLEYDNPSIRYRIGYIQYKRSDYAEALGSFMKAGDGNTKPENLLLAMANTLSLRGDDYAAQGYYHNLIDALDIQVAEKGLVLPQVNAGDYDLVQTYLTASNNYGVTLHRLAARTGNSDLNAKAIVQLSQSVRAWDALTRNQQTMVRLEGSNLAQENIKYITHPVAEYEPAIYTEIPRVLDNNEGIN